jgi:hypothetical protein
LVTDHGGKHGHRMILSELQERSSVAPCRYADRRAAFPLLLAIVAVKKKFDSTSVSHGEVAMSLNFVEDALLPRSQLQPLEQALASANIGSSGTHCISPPPPWIVLLVF